MKYDAVAFSLAGDKYLGRAYGDMDCQKFVEKCMADVGYHRDLPGSNAWFRAMDWTGTPEECMKEFGCVPKGALLFIHAFDGGEEERGYHDGKGNASHIGIKTGRSGADSANRAKEAGVKNAQKYNCGDGAIHSSSSRGGVVTSKFADKTIRNGGWNMVGLLKVFDYGKAVNWILDHGGGKPPDDQDDKPGEGEIPMQGKVVAENGSTVKLRQKPSAQCSLYWDIPVGSPVTVLEQGDSWSKCTTGGLTGWMLNQFIQLEDDPDEPIAPEPGEYEDDLDPDPDPDTLVTIRLNAAQVSAAYPVLQAICEQIVAQVGRG